MLGCVHASENVPNCKYTIIKIHWDSISNVADTFWESAHTNILHLLGADTGSSARNM